MKEETKKAAQMDSLIQLLNNKSVHAVIIDGEVYVIRVEKYAPAKQTLGKCIHLLTNTQL